MLFGRHAVARRALQDIGCEWRRLRAVGDMHSYAFGGSPGRETISCSCREGHGRESGQDH